MKLPEFIKTAAVTRQRAQHRTPDGRLDGLDDFVLLLSSEWVLRKVFGMIMRSEVA